MLLGLLKLVLKELPSLPEAKVIGGKLISQKNTSLRKSELETELTAAVIELKAPKLKLMVNSVLLFQSQILAHGLRSSAKTH
jgi:hypothetical protein